MFMWIEFKSVTLHTVYTILSYAETSSFEHCVIDAPTRQPEKVRHETFESNSINQRQVLHFLQCLFLNISLWQGSSLDI